MSSHMQFGMTSAPTHRPVSITPRARLLQSEDIFRAVTDRPFRPGTLGAARQHVMALHANLTQAHTAVQELGEQATSADHALIGSMANYQRGFIERFLRV